MINSRVNFLVKIPNCCWDINKTRQGITFISRTLYILQYLLRSRQECMCCHLWNTVVKLSATVRYLPE